MWGIALGLDEAVGLALGVAGFAGGAAWVEGVEREGLAAGAAGFHLTASASPST